MEGVQSGSVCVVEIVTFYFDFGEMTSAERACSGRANSDESVVQNARLAFPVVPALTDVFINLENILVGQAVQ